MRNLFNVFYLNSGGIIGSLQYYGFNIVFRKKNKSSVNLKIGRCGNMDSSVIISSVCKAVQNCTNKNFSQSCEFLFLQFCTALFTLLMMTAESMLSKRPVLRFSGALLFLSYFRPIVIVFVRIFILFLCLFCEFAEVSMPIFAIKSF